MKKHTIVILAAAAILGICGCSEKKETYSREGNELVLRFFRNVRAGHSAAAAEQARKLGELDNNNDYVIHLITVQDCNDCIERAQKELNSGNVEAAIKILKEGSEKHPKNSSLRRMYGRAKQTGNARTLLAAMRKADTPSGMEAAMVAAMAGLSDVPASNIGEFFDYYRKRIDAAKKREAAEIAARDKRQKEEDKARDADNARRKKLNNVPEPKLKGR